MEQIQFARLAGLSAGVTLVFAPFSGWAGDTDANARVTPAFGNTVLSVYPDGRSQKIWMHPDGSWDGRSRRGNPLAGRWSIRDDKVCVKQSSPPTLPVSFCMPFPAKTKVGASWPAKDLSGTPITLKIVRGKIGHS